MAKKVKTLKLPEVSEDTIHQHIVQWFYMQNFPNAFIHHSPNENPRGTAMLYNTKMKRMGRLAGFPDLIIGQNGRIIFIEVKRQSGSLNPNQKQIIPMLENCNFNVKIVRSLDEAEVVINNFMIR